ncbi:MAG: AAA family ATPase [Desulfobacterales bacterium]|nr:AAA family ATPase [Desulfobacterales bacterium]
MNSHFSLSPSRIARFFFHECDRYLRYHATPKAERKAAGIPDIPFDTSPVTKAILESGYNWEKNVIHNKLNGKVRTAKGESRLCERSHGAEESLTLLKNLEPGEAIYQPTFKAPHSFYNRYGLDTALCNFPPCRPDLVQLVENNGKTFLRIIDIKASSNLKASHRIQAALYTLILKEILLEQVPNMLLDSDTAGIWLFGQETPEWFDLRLSTRAIGQFLGTRLNDILTAPIDKVNWHLFFRCEWCEFYKPCREQAEKTKSVSLVPYMSVGGRRYLKQEIADQAGSVNSLDELKIFLENSSSDKLLDPCGSLRGKRNRLQNAVEALQKREVIPHGGSSPALPESESISIVVTLQDDPVSGEVYTAGFRRIHGKDVYEKSYRTEVFIAKTPEECISVRHRFLGALYDELSLLDAYNKRQHNWNKQKTLQVYVFDSFEAALFNQVLLKAAGHTDMAPVAMQLLFYFQNPSLARAEKHPEHEIPFPIIALTSIIRRLVALPLPLCLRLPEVAGMLPSPDFTFEFEPNDLFWFNLSNTLKSDAIFQAWNLGNTDAVEWIHDEIKRRLRATHSVIDGLREKVREKLFAHPPRFFFPGSPDFENPELSRLAFIVRYESFMSAMKLRETRTLPWPERVSQGKSIPLKLEHGNRWKVESEIDSASLDKANGFPNYILVPAGEEGEQAQMAYNDYAHRKSVYPPKNSEVRLAGIKNLDSDEKTGLATRLYLEVKYGKYQKCFSTGDKAVLHPRLTDFNSDRIISRIREIDDLGTSDFFTLIKNPGKFASKIRVKKESKNSALKAAKKYAGFTKSQNKAFRQFLTNRLTLVWGPPGTGKTHFLAKAVLCMAEACKQENRQLRVAITAFTHAAIENLLEEICENIPVFGLKNSVSLFKLKQFSGHGKSIKVLSEKALYKVMDEDILIVGGTVYSFQKTEIEEEFPILIVDEASQMKFGELALGMIPLARKGRMVFAGDDLQLPPIIQGEYPEPEDGLPGLHNSVFAYLRARDNIGDDTKNPYTIQLQENWRMNKTLSFFPASTLYGEDYMPVNRDVKTQKLVFKQNKNRKKESEFCEWLVDPDYPLALCIPEDIRAAKENRLEARMVAMLSVYLRTRLVKSGTKIYPNSEKGDTEFWRKGLFIVSPHHVQIRAIKRELCLLRKWKSRPFVDTVDKMQGQQCQAVIVSYGVSDVETALAEADFIYSLNRLNVSVTRARSKCIVFLPRPLLEPSFEALQNEKAARGLGHMHSLADFCSILGEQREFALDFMNDKGRITVMRV